MKEVEKCLCKNCELESTLNSKSFCNISGAQCKTTCDECPSPINHTCESYQPKSIGIEMVAVEPDFSYICNSAPKEEEKELPSFIKMIPVFNDDVISRGSLVQVKKISTSETYNGIVNNLFKERIVIRYWDKIAKSFSEKDITLQDILNGHYKLTILSVEDL